MIRKNTVMIAQLKKKGKRIGQMIIKDNHRFALFLANVRDTCLHDKQSICHMLVKQLSSLPRKTHGMSFGVPLRHGESSRNY
jgi:hypothetical protein